jgi:lysyl-tRNA synthetase class 2
MTEPHEHPPVDENKLIAERREKLNALRAHGNAFPNDFRPDAFADDLRLGFEGKDAADVEAAQRRVSVAGRLLAKRVMGKASFVQIQDMTGRIQLFLQQSALGETYDAFKAWDVGDIVGAEGVLIAHQDRRAFSKVDKLRLLTKSLRPLPDKEWHGYRRQAALSPALRGPDHHGGSGVYSHTALVASVSSASGSRPNRGVSWKSKRR